MKEDTIMKKIVCLFILVTIVMTVACSSTELGEHTREPTANGALPVVSVCSGDEVGRDIICWIGDFGFCYDLDEEAFCLQACSIEIGEDVFLDGCQDEHRLLEQGHPLLDYQEPAGYGYPVWLRHGDRRYRIGLLRTYSKPNRYGVYYDFYTYYDIKADLLPCTPIALYDDWERRIGGVVSASEQEGQIYVSECDMVLSDAVWIEKDVQKEQMQCALQEQALGVISCFDENIANMLVKRDILLGLMERGYFETPCWLVIEGEQIRLVVEICNP